MSNEQRSIGLQRGTVHLVAYDPAWPFCFDAEAARLAERIARAGLPPIRFEHIGSTAVPGLEAKPIIDLMAGHRDGAALHGYFRVLQKSGYAHRGPQGVPLRELFVLGPEHRRTHHLNLVSVGGSFWREHIAFRDRLRSEPTVRAAYAALKQRLAVAHPNDREAYTAGKAAFVAQFTTGTHAP